jgi:glycosyltransferase involved in cell wall biosynthesis
MRVAIATPNLTAWDGVGNDVLGMARALRGRGHRVGLFADDARIDEHVRPLADLFRAARGADDMLIYHHSIQCETGVRAIEELPGRKVVKYHNITPPRFFAGIDAETAGKAAVGLKQAVRLCRTDATVWVDSAFNGRELGEIAPDGAFAELPPFQQADRLAATAPDAHAVAGLDGWGTVILCVGRVAPNKNLGLAVDTFAAYRRQFDPTARLVIAGEHIFHGYSQTIGERVKEHGIDDSVVVSGRVSVPHLKALYMTADALLVTSDHEGFCVPLAEAMVLGTPVVAVPHAAIPDTAGDAARYAVPTPASLAEALDEVIAGESRERRLAAGRRRYDEHFTTAAIERRFLELFELAV